MNDGKMIAVWDLMLMEDLKDHASGQACIVVGNGPSLREVERKFLHSLPAFGANRVYLLDNFIPIYYVAINPLVIEQSLAEIASLQCDYKFVRDECTDILISQNVMIGSYYPLRTTTMPTFSRDPFEFVYEGYTVTYVCLQLAYYMGFSTVLLVGVDHSYEMDGAPNEETVRRGDDPNHFSPDYFGDGVTWNNPDLVGSERAYKMARTVFEADGRRIVNLTPDSKLDVFERGEVAEWM